MLNGAVKDFNFAARVKGSGIQSTQFLLTPEPNVTYSACLVSKIEEMFATGKAPYPVERTLHCQRDSGELPDFAHAGPPAAGDTASESEVPSAPPEPALPGVSRLASNGR